MNRIERLINLTATLLEADRMLTREEIVERVPGYDGKPDTVRRAFERDKETLRELGVPIVTGPVDPSAVDVVHGYRIPKEDYYLPDPGLDPDELAALHLAATAVRLPGTRGTEALWKLGGTTAAGAPPATADLPGSEHLVALFGAVADRRIVTFRYRDAVRELEPWRLQFRNGHWYVAGHERGAGEERNFRLDRIEGAVTVGEPGSFEPSPAAGEPGDAHPWLYGDGDRVVATLLVDPDQAPWVVGHLGEAAVVDRRDDGAVVFDVPVVNRDAFRSFVLGFLDHAEVLAPPEIREGVVAWLESIAGAP